MTNKIINELLNLFDEYINTLRHISCFNLDVDKVNSINGFTSVDDMNGFLCGNINEAHSNLIAKVNKKMLGSLANLDDVKDYISYIYYPDFKVKTYINNPVTFYQNNMSLEKVVIISPVYELNLVRNDQPNNNGKTLILRVKRLALAPRINIFSNICDEVDDNLMNYVLNGLIQKFRDKYNGEPNKNDLIFLTNVALKYIFDDLYKHRDNSLDVLYQGDVHISYDYNVSKKTICNRYNVVIEDKYKSISSVLSPWIYRGLVSFDNREIAPNKDNTIIPLTYMRIRK